MTFRKSHGDKRFGVWQDLWRHVLQDPASLFTAGDRNARPTLADVTQAHYTTWGWASGLQPSFLPPPNIIMQTSTRYLLDGSHSSISWAG